MNTIIIVVKKIEFLGSNIKFSYSSEKITMSRDPLKMLKNLFPDDNKKNVKNAVLLLLIPGQLDKKGNPKFRVVMTLETGNVWGFPGGQVDKGEKPFQAAIRELYEETGMKFCFKYWNRAKEVKFTRRNTRFYCSYWTGPVFKGNPKNREVAFVDIPRWENLLTSLQTGCPLTCGKHTAELRRCMHTVIGYKFKKNTCQ